MNKLVYQMMNSINKYEEKILNAVVIGDLNTLETFITSGVAEHSKMPILATICERKRFDLAVLAIQKGVAVDIGDKGYTPLYYAAKYEHGPLTLLLIEKGVRLSFENETKNNVLMLLAESDIGTNQQDLILIADAALKKGLDINAVDKGGWSALHYAAYKRHVGLIRFLIQKGANVNLRATNGKLFTPIQLAIGPKDYWESNYQVFHENGGLDGIIYHKGNEYDIENYLRAIEFGYTEVVEKYLAEGADPNQRKLEKGGFGDQNTALILAVYSHTPETVEVLVKHGASLKDTNRNNETAFTIAQRIRDQAMVNTLVGLGASA